MTPKIGDNITFGLDYRTQFLYSEEISRTDFQQMTGSIYTNVGLTKNINLIGRYDFINEIWEAYGVAHILPNNGYIKAGSFVPNYGIRMDDHTAYTRGGDFFLLSSGGGQGLIYSPFYTEAGVEAGLYISNFALFTASAGSNLLYNKTLSKDPTYTTSIEFYPRIGKLGLLFGGSYAAAKIPRAADFYGGFIGFGLMPGMIIFSKSRKMPSMDSPLAGGTAGIICLISPGSTRATTWYFSTFSKLIGDPVHELVSGAPEILVFHGILLVPGRFRPRGAPPIYAIYRQDRQKNA